MVFLGRVQPVASGSAANVRPMCRVCNLLLTLWAGRVTFNILPDDVLLHIFFIDGQDYCESPLTFIEREDLARVGRLPWKWHRLVHVCRRWRSIVFSSPDYLDLRLVCGPMTPIELTGIWPPLPIIITNSFDRHMFRNHEDYDFDAAMVHPNRVREIWLFDLTRSFFQRLASATQIQEQFPALTYLTLDYIDSHPASALPDEFLGGSAPLLQYLGLHRIPFPALPKLLLSATHLVRLVLSSIPHSGYFSPETIVNALAGMTNLETLFIKFESPLSRPHRERRHPPPLVHTVLPALTRCQFKAVSEYLEDFVSRIDAPLLESISIVFFHQLIFDIPQLAQFMRRSTRIPEPKEVHVKFDYTVHVDTLPRRQLFYDSGLKISCRDLDWQLSSLVQVFLPFIPSINMVVEHLYIYEQVNEVRDQPQHDIENMQWLEIFYPFTAVKNLYLSEKCVPYIVPALQELVGGKPMEVLPTLQNLILEGFEPSGASRSIVEGIENFVAARQLSDYPITVSRWERA
jgi:hypothetical protein